MNMIRILLTLFIAALTLNVTAQNYDAEREQMVKWQIKNRGISDPKVLDAMRVVERHNFVPRQYRSRAYRDGPLSIGHGQTISQPYIVALMTEKLQLDKNDKVLEIGTGSGYQAAVLAEITPHVYSIEIIEELAIRARETLREQGYSNVHLKIGDGFKGWKKYAPFDGIIVTCSPSDVPKPLKNQLAENGRMVIPVGGPYVQKLVVLEKKNGKIRKSNISSVRFVPMVDDEGERY
jgi:protein-L-isoaspartate(D-aspartate) O-methyltransferase